MPNAAIQVKNGGNDQRLHAQMMGKKMWISQDASTIHIPTPNADRKTVNARSNICPSPQFPRDVRLISAYGAGIEALGLSYQGSIRRTSSLNFTELVIGMEKTTDLGRRFIWLKRRGEEARLPSYKVGRRPKEEDLRIRWSWFWQYFAGGRSYHEIARELGLEYSLVEKKVESLITSFPRMST